MSKKILIAVLSVCILIPVVIMGLRAMTDYSSVLKVNWGFSLPSKAHFTELYENEEPDGSILGDGYRFHLYSYKYEDAVGRMFSWSGAEKSTIFNSSYSEAAAEWLDKLEIPQEYRPDYNNCLYWYQAQDDNSEIIVFWNSDIDRLYIIESFF